MFSSNCLFSDSSGSVGVWSLLLSQVFGFVLELAELWNVLVLNVHFRFSSDFRSCVPAGLGRGLGYRFSSASSTDQSQSCSACCVSIPVSSGALKPPLA